MQLLQNSIQVDILEIFRSSFREDKFPDAISYLMRPTYALKCVISILIYHFNLTGGARNRIQRIEAASAVRKR